MLLNWKISCKCKHMKINQMQFQLSIELKFELKYEEKRNEKFP